MDSKELKLYKNTIIYSIANIGSQMLRFILIPLYTYYLSKAEYGLYDVLITITILIEPVSTLKIKDAVYRWLVAQEKEADVVINKSMFFTLCVSAFIVLISAIVIPFTDNIILYTILSFVVLNRVLNTLAAEIVRGIKKNMIYAAGGMIYMVVFLLSTLILLVWLNLGINGVLFSNAIAFLISTLFYTKFIIPYITNGETGVSEKGLLIEWLRYSIPLIPSAINWWILRLSNRMLITSFFGFAANGIFAVSNMLPSIITVFNNIFYLAWQESYLSEYNSKDRDIFFSHMFKRFMNFQFGLAIALVGCTKLIFLIVNPDFSDAWKYSHLLFLGAVFQSFSAFFTSGYLSSKETTGAFTTSLLGAITNIAVNIVLLRLIGLQAASLGVMLGFLVMWLVRIKHTRMYFTIKIDVKTLALSCGIFSLISLLTFVNIEIVDYILPAVGIGVFILLNRHFIQDIITKIKAKYLGKVTE